MIAEFNRLRTTLKIIPHDLERRSLDRASHRLLIMSMGVGAAGPLYVKTI